MVTRSIRRVEFPWRSFTVEATLVSGETLDEIGVSLGGGDFVSLDEAELIDRWDEIVAAGWEYLTQGRMP